MRKTVLLLASMASAFLLASGVAIAAGIQCPTEPGTNLCIGTRSVDTLKGTARSDIMDARGGIDDLVGKQGADQLRGGGGFDGLWGGFGADALDGGKHSDTLVGGPGTDVLKGGADADSYSFRGYSWGTDTLEDVPEPLEPPTPSNPYYGYNFLQAAFFEDDSPPSESQPLTINLASSASSPEVTTASGTSTVNWSNDAIDRVRSLGHGNDTIIGNPAANYIDSSNGDDTISSGGGADLVNVSDFPLGALGDSVDCGEGIDTVVHNSGDSISANCEIRELIDPSA